MVEMHSQARASSPYELVPNILQYIFNNIYLSLLFPIQSGIVLISSNGASVLRKWQNSFYVNNYEFLRSTELTLTCSM